MSAVGTEGFDFGVPADGLSGFVGMKLVEPVLHVAESAQQVQARFAQVEPGVERVKVFLALVDAGLLLGRGRKLRRRAGRVARAVAQFQLRQDALQLLVGDLLLQAGDLSLRIQFAQAAR